MKHIEREYKYILKPEINNYKNMLKKYSFRIYDIEQYYLMQKDTMNLRLRHDYEHITKKRSYHLTLKKGLMDDFKNLEIEQEIEESSFNILKTESIKSLSKRRYKLFLPDMEDFIEVDVFKHGFVMAEIETEKDYTNNLPEFIKNFGCYCVGEQDKRFFNVNLIDIIDTDIYGEIKKEKSYFENSHEEYIKRLSL